MNRSVNNAHAEGRLNLFFLEMIIVLLFFGIASAVIISAFAASDRISRESEQLENITFCAQSAAEIFSKSGNLSEVTEELFGIPANGYTTVPLDKNCGYSPLEPELYLALDTPYGDADGLSELNMVFTNADGERIYQLTAGAYLPREGDDER